MHKASSFCSTLPLHACNEKVVTIISYYGAACKYTAIFYIEKHSNIGLQETNAICFSLYHYTCF